MFLQFNDDVYFSDRWTAQNNWSKLELFLVENLVGCHHKWIKKRNYLFEVWTYSPTHSLNIIANIHQIQSIVLLSNIYIRIKELKGCFIVNKIKNLILTWWLSGSSSLKHTWGKMSFFYGRQPIKERTEPIKCVGGRDGFWYSSLYLLQLISSIFNRFIEEQIY